MIMSCRPNTNRVAFVKQGVVANKVLGDIGKYLPWWFGTLDDDGIKRKSLAIGEQLKNPSPQMRLE